MKKISYWNITTSYIKYRWITLSMYGIFLGVFLILFYLYSIPLDAVLYGLLLTGVIGAVFLCLEIYRFGRTHKELSKLLDVISRSDHRLPRPHGTIEQDYQALIRGLLAEHRDSISMMDGKYSDMMDYYTLWVHQIKIPISAMRMLIQSEDSAVSKELLQELFKVEQYVEMVLQYLRLDNISSDLFFAKYDLSDMMKQAIKKYASVFIHKKIKLDLQEFEYQVLTDEKWFVFVLEQFLSNALKYTKEGQITIRLEQGSILVIEDTGIGIQEEDLPRIFEKGFTGFNGRMDKKSTGIGLFLCKEILNKLSHPFWIESIVGQGTKVKIELFRKNHED